MLLKDDMNIKVENCKNCPFYQYQYDDWAIGNPETHTCKILQDKYFSKMDLSKPNDYFIKFDKKGNVKSKNKETLDNCPLLKENINVEL